MHWLWCGWRLPEYIYTILCCQGIGQWRKKRKELPHKLQAIPYAELQEARREQEMGISLMEDPLAHQIPPRIKGMHMTECSFMDDTIQFAIHNSPDAFPEFLEKGECEMLVAYETGQIIVLPCTRGQPGVYDSSMGFRRFNIETASPTQSSSHAKPQWVSNWPNSEHINPDTRFHCRVVWFYTPDGSMVPGQWPCQFRGIPVGRPTQPFWADVQEVCVDGFPLTKGLMWRLRKFSIILDLVVIETAKKRNNIKRSAYHHRLPCSLHEERSISPTTPNGRIIEPVEVTNTTYDSSDELGRGSLNSSNFSPTNDNSILESVYHSHSAVFHSLGDPIALHSSSYNTPPTFTAQGCQTVDSASRQNERLSTVKEERPLAREPPGELTLSPSGPKPRLFNSLSNDRLAPLATIEEEASQGLQNVVATSSTSSRVVAEGLEPSMDLSPKTSENAHGRCLNLRTKALSDQNLYKIGGGGGGTEPLSQHLGNLSASFAHLKTRKVPETVEHSTSASAEGVKQVYQSNINSLPQILIMKVRNRPQILHTKLRPN